jgi:hypothetical protein
MKIFNVVASFAAIGVIGAGAYQYTKQTTEPPRTAKVAQPTKAKVSKSVTLTVDEKKQSVTVKNARDIRNARITEEARKKAKQKLTETNFRTITFHGHTIAWVNAAGWSAAPAHGAGVWQGTGSTNDGAPTYFIGHNPGDFSPEMKLAKGDPIEVTDTVGKHRTYHVNRIIVVDDDSINVKTGVDEWDNMVNAPGERIVLQTCITDSTNRIVFAE